MKPEAQRIAIAEACGWKSLPMPVGCPEAWEAPEGSMFADAINDCYLPDYLNDLNAMHEAVMAQTNKFRDHYEDNLWIVIGASEDRKTLQNWRDFTNATAAQRAEAFLRTLNLWVEGKPVGHCCDHPDCGICNPF